jgi:GNAT superfamily N-acetyltransferase
MDVTTSVRRAERSEIAGLAHSLAGAFYDDPVLSYSWPDDTRRLRRSTWYFASQLRALWERREVHTLGNRSSVAVWARPDEWEIPLGAVARLAATSLRTRVRLRSLVAYLETDKLHPEEPHWYLEFLGTIPAMQGKGLGGQVLAPVLARADEEGVAVWTWSSNRRNLAFYHRHGFVVLEERLFTAGGPPIFPIRREPR